MVARKESYSLMALIIYQPDPILFYVIQPCSESGVNKKGSNFLKPFCLFPAPPNGLNLNQIFKDLEAVANLPEWQIGEII